MTIYLLAGEFGLSVVSVTGLFFGAVGVGGGGGRGGLRRFTVIQKIKWQKVDPNSKQSLSLTTVINLDFPSPSSISQNLIKYHYIFILFFYGESILWRINFFSLEKHILKRLHICKYWCILKLTPQLHQIIHTIQLHSLQFYILQH